MSSIRESMSGVFARTVEKQNMQMLSVVDFRVKSLSGLWAGS
jgi:hypothetical protein